jgi:hypothetical protein
MGAISGTCCFSYEIIEKLIAMYDAFDYSAVPQQQPTRNWLFAWFYCTINYLLPHTLITTCFLTLLPSTVCALCCYSWDTHEQWNYFYILIQSQIDSVLVIANERAYHNGHV